MAFDDLPADPGYSRPNVTYETRNILDGSSAIIGTLTLPTTTSEPEWALKLALYTVSGLSINVEDILETLLSNATSAVTTSSSTASVIGGMTSTPVAGTYLAFFSGNVKTDGASAKGEFGIYVDGVQLTETRRDVSCALTLLGGLVSVSLNTIGVGTYTGTKVQLNGNNTLDVRYKSNNGGTIGFNERSLMLIKVKDV